MPSNLVIRTLSTSGPYSSLCIVSQPLEGQVRDRNRFGSAVECGNCPVPDLDPDTGDDGRG